MLTEDKAWQRAIIHVDLDAFYASVEQRANPSLQGKPVAVAGYLDNQGKLVTTRSVVSAASYEARVYGVKSAMPLQRALQLCPQLMVVPVNFGLYRQVSGQIFEILKRFTPLIQPLSLDEAFLDVTGSVAYFGSPQVIARQICDSIKSELNLDASFGVATNKTVAKIASDLKKPRGFVVVEPGDEKKFLEPLQLRRMPGIGPVTEKNLQNLGITTIGQLANVSEKILKSQLGVKSGQSLLAKANGVDISEVELPGSPKTISKEETFNEDEADIEIINQRLADLSQEIGKRLRENQLFGGRVIVKIKYPNFQLQTHQLTLSHPTCVGEDIFRSAKELFLQVWKKQPIRLLGVGVGVVEPSPQLDLFAESEASKDFKVEVAMDKISSKFGSQTIFKGAWSHGIHDLDFRSEDLKPQ